MRPFVPSARVTVKVAVPPSVTVWSLMLQVVAWAASAEPARSVKAVHNRQNRVWFEV